MKSGPEYQLTFVRHGESIGNKENRFQGKADFPLSENGRRQAEMLAERWKSEGRVFDYVISSPLSRALETAQIITAGLGVPLIETDPIWMERDNGKREGMTWDEVQEHFPEPDFFSMYDNVAETGEGDWALYLRAGEALHKILQRSPGRYLIASHGAILNQVFHSILGIVPQPNHQGAGFRLVNTAVSVFYYYPAVHRWSVRVIGDTRHLQAGSYFE